MLKILLTKMILNHLKTWMLMPKYQKKKFLKVKTRLQMKLKVRVRVKNGATFLSKVDSVMQLADPLEELYFRFAITKWVSEQRDKICNIFK